MTGVPMVLTPAYGRDYKSKKALDADFRADKDFVANSMGNSSYTNRADLVQLGFAGRTVQVRYGKLCKVAVLVV